MPLPAVLTIQSGGNKLRYATLMGIKRAKTKEVRRVDAPQSAGAPSSLLDGISVPKKQRSTQMIDGDARQAAATLVEKLKFEARIL